jgi:hypothetical protein
MQFIKIFKGFSCDIEDMINDMIQERTLNVISVTSCVYRYELCVIVVFDE